MFAICFTIAYLETSSRSGFSRRVERELWFCRILSVSFEAGFAFWLHEVNKIENAAKIRAWKIIADLKVIFLFMLSNLSRTILIGKTRLNGVIYSNYYLCRSEARKPFFYRVLAESAFLHSFIKIGIWVIMLLCLL